MTASAAICRHFARVVPALGAVRMQVATVVVEVLTILMALRAIRIEFVLILAHFSTIVTDIPAIAADGQAILTNAGAVLPQGLAILGKCGRVAAFLVATQGIEILPTLALGLIQRAFVLIVLADILAQIGPVTRDVLLVTLDVPIIAGVHGQLYVECDKKSVSN